MRHLWNAGLVVGLALIVSSTVHADETLTSSDWRIAVSTPYYGELDGLFYAREDGRRIVLASRSELAERLGELPSSGNWFPEDATLAFRLRQSEPGHFQGRFATLQGSFRRGHVDANLTVQQDQLNGTIASGSPFSGEFIGRPHDQPAPLRSYTEINATIEQRINEDLYDPRLLEEEEFLNALQIQRGLSGAAIDDFDLILTYALTARRMPFSHFGLTRPAGGLAALLDTRQMRGSDTDQVVLTYVDDIAVLTIESFVGETIPQQIAAAFEAIHAAQPHSLIVDLRNNGGGSLAGATLANNLLPERTPIGVFTSSHWWRDNSAAPTIADTYGAEPFRGDTLQDFYDALSNASLVPVYSNPVESPYAGQVYILASAQSTSMTELFLDAMRQTGRATIIGEPTPGEMLSSRFYDVGEGFVLRIPIADYFSMENGRLEGVGVPPHIEVPSEDALDHALGLARANAD